MHCSCRVALTPRHRGIDLRDSLQGLRVTAAQAVDQALRGRLQLCRQNETATSIVEVEAQDFQDLAIAASKATQQLRNPSSLELPFPLLRPLLRPMPQLTPSQFILPSILSELTAQRACATHPLTRC